MPDPGSKPLTPAVLHILLALASQDRHGYAIMKQVQADSDGQVKMGPGTLYGALSRMTELGLVRESESRIDPTLDDQRRIYYAITAAGRDALSDELKRYRKIITLAKSRPSAEQRGGLNHAR